LQALRDRRARVCVATDVASRGIDLPSLSLVVHVEMPRDAEVLQHRSGRTGRAGKKGTAVLIVPYPRRRRVEGMLRGAKIAAEWGNVPTAEDIRAKDRERLLETLLAPVEIDEDDAALAEQLLAQKTPQEIAAALVHAHRASMPAPEEMIDRSPAQGQNAGPAQAERGAHRPGFDDIAWFRMNIGRRQNADPRWVLPLICRRGHVTKNEIGAIRIGQTETQFQIPRAIAARFAAAVRATANAEGEDENGVMIEPMQGAPAPLTRANGGGDRPNAGPRKALYRAKPTGAPRGPRPQGARPR
jgi:ATP-dependent RNA helicase DeaD